MMDCLVQILPSLRLDLTRLAVLVRRVLRVLDPDSTLVEET